MRNTVERQFGTRIIEDFECQPTELYILQSVGEVLKNFDQRCNPSSNSDSKNPL